jgi:hypothetical protein
MFVVFGAPLVSSRMKTQTTNRSTTTMCPENWNFQQHPLNSSDHYSWTIYLLRVCKYLLEMNRSYLQLLNKVLFPNLYPLRSALVLAVVAHSGQILSKTAKLT